MFYFLKNDVIRTKINNLVFSDWYHIQIQHQCLQDKVSSGSHLKFSIWLCKISIQLKIFSLGIIKCTHHYKMLTKIVVITENKKRHETHLLYGEVQSLLRTWPGGKHAVDDPLGNSLVTIYLMKNLPLGKVRVAQYEKLLKFQGHNKYGLEVLRGPCSSSLWRFMNQAGADKCPIPTQQHCSCSAWASLMLLWRLQGKDQHTEPMDQHKIHTYHKEIMKSKHQTLLCSVNLSFFWSWE